MKRKQITAILLSAIMTVTACMPMNSISAVAAETSGAGNTETAAVVEMQEEEAPVEEAEPDTAVAAQEVQEEQTVEADPAAEPEESGKEATEAELAVEDAAEEEEKIEAVTEDTAEEEAAAQSEEPAAEAVEEKTAEPIAEEAPAAETVKEEADQAESSDQKVEAAQEEAVAEETKEQEKAKNAKKAADPTPVDFENATPIEVGTPISVSLTPENAFALFKFIPDVSSQYSFYSSLDGDYLDTFGELYDSDYNRITYDDEEGDNGHFRISIDLEAGQTYYLLVRLYNTDNSGDFNVVLKLKSLNVEIPETTEYTVTPGESQILSVNATSVYPITYKWKVDGEEVGTNSESITITPEGYTYVTCEISDGNDTETLYFSIRVGYLSLSLSSDVIDDDYGNSYFYVGPNEKAELDVEVSASDLQGVYYRWTRYSKNDEGNWEYSEEISSTDSVEDGHISFTTVEINEPVRYVLDVYDQYGNYTFINFIVSVDTHFVAYPEGYEGQTSVEVYVEEGDSATLRVIASADTELQYKWVQDYEYTTDVTSSEYVTGPIYGDTTYYCCVTDAYGNQKTVTFDIHPEYGYHYLYAYDEEYYSSEPEYTVNPGESKRLGVIVECDEDVSSLTYEWQKRPVSGDDDDYETIDGATGSEYTIGGVQNSVYYRCVVRNRHGNSSYVTFLLSIDNDLRVYAGENSTSYSKEYGVAYEASQPLMVTVRANDTTDLTYEWLCGVNEDYDEAELIEGATTDTYTVDPVTTSQYYYCRVTDRFGNRDYVQFHVYVQTHLTAYPFGGREDDNYWHYSVIPGDPFTLTTVAKADGDAQLTYEWFEQDEWDNIRLESTGNTHQIEAVTSSKEYKCIVSDQYGNKKNVYFYVEADNKLTLIAIGGDENYADIYVPYNQKVKLQVKASVLRGGMNYRWYDETWEEFNYGDVSGPESTIELEVGPITRSTHYSCRVEDEYGHQRDVSFYVYVQNHFKAYPEGSSNSDTVYIYAKPGSQVNLKTIIEADDRNGLSVNWYDDWDYMDLHSDNITVNASNETYYCEVTDKYGNQDRAYFYVRLENHLEAYPEGAGVDANGNHLTEVVMTPNAGSQLNLKVIAKADVGGLNYYWEKRDEYPNAWGEIEYDYSEIAGQTGNTLSVTADRSTKYRCYVEDAYGGSVVVYFTLNVGSLSSYPEGAEIINGVRSNRVAISAAKDESKTLSVVTSAPSGAQLTYKWTEGPLGDSSWWPLEEGMTDNAKNLTITVTESKRYLCVVTDQYGNQALNYFYVNIGGMKLSSNIGKPSLTGDNRYELDVPVKVGQKLTLKTIVDSSSSEISYTWKSLYEGWFTMPGETGDSITITGGDTSDYRCEVADANGNVAYITYHMDIIDALTVTPVGAASGSNRAVITAKTGDTVTLSVKITGTSADNSYTRWTDSKGRYISSGETSVAVKATASTTYTCEVEDRFGKEYYAYFDIVTGDTSISSTDITVSPTSYTYDGKAKTPAVTVKYRGSALVINKDYKVTYSNNVNAGTGKVTVTGITLSGSVSKNFTIAKAGQAPAATASAVAAGKTGTFTVTGSYGALSVKTSNAKVATVSVSGKTVTVKGVAPGTATITITAAGDGNHNSKAITCSVKILPAATKTFKAANVTGKGIKLTWAQVAGANGYIIYRNNKKIKTITSGKTKAYTDTGANTNGSKYTYKIYAKASTGTSPLYKSVIMYKLSRPAVKSLSNSSSKKMTVKWAKNAKAKGYQIQYGLKSNFSGAKTVKITKNATVSKVIGSLKKGKTYYVRIRTYKTVSGKTYYSAWSASKKLKINQ